MSEEYLTTDAIFSCPIGMKFKAMESGNKGFLYEDTVILTVKADLIPASAPIQCPLLPLVSGAPQMCQCSVGKLFTGKTESICGYSVVTDTAKAKCEAYPPTGQFVTVEKSGTSGHLMYSELMIAESKCNEESVGAERPGPKEDDAYKGDTALSHVSDNDVAIIKDVSEVEMATAYIGKDEKASGEKKSPQNTVRDNIEDSLSTEEDISMLLCSYSPDKKKCKQCKYPKTTTVIKNDRSALKRAYECRDEYDKHYEEMRIIYPYYNYPAHHIIPATETLERIKPLAKLANFYGYDANNTFNCIFLVSKYEGYGEHSNDVKHGSAYDAMSVTGMQWHLSGHGRNDYFNFSKEELEEIQKNIQSYERDKNFSIGINFEGTIMTYSGIVRRRLTELMQAISRRRKCLDKEEYKAFLLKSLNELSKDVRQYLTGFLQDRRKSYPYYVSAEAYRFAFGIPETTKFIAILPCESGKITLQRFRARHGKADIKAKRHLTINPIRGESARSFDVSLRGERLECIEYCGNIKCFVLFPFANCNLPFYIPSSKILPLAEIAKEQGFFMELEWEEGDCDPLLWLMRMDNVLLGWLRENAGNHDESRIKVIEQRIRESEG